MKASQCLSSSPVEDSRSPGVHGSIPVCVKDPGGINPYQSVVSPSLRSSIFPLSSGRQGSSLGNEYPAATRRAEPAEPKGMVQSANSIPPG